MDLEGIDPSDQTIRLTLDVDYGQFYVEDQVQPGASDEVLDGTALEYRLGARCGIVAIITAKQYGPVQVEFRLHPRNPPRHPEGDHVAEVSVEFPSGQIAFAECTGRTGLAPVRLNSPGPYRCRVSWLNLANSDRNEDHYRIELWPAPAEPPRVLTWWPEFTLETVINPYGLRVLPGRIGWDARVNGMKFVGRRKEGSLHYALLQDREGALWEYPATDGMGLIEIPESLRDRYEPWRG